MRSRESTTRRGFSMVEMLVSIALVGMLLALTVPLFRTQITAFENHAGRLDAQQNARFGASMIDRDLRTAGVGLPDLQPMVIQAAPNAITFSGDLVSRFEDDVAAVYYDPDALAPEVVSLTFANRITLPLSTVGYPDTTYTQQGGAPSEAETISFWVAADPDPGATGLSALYRRVNNGAVTLVAKALVLRAGEPVFRYFKADSLGQPVEISQGLLPLTHLAKIHGSKADTAKSALTDSIRFVRVHLNGVYTDRRATQIIKSIDTGVRIMNAGLLRYHTCGEPPLFSSGITAVASTDPDPMVVLGWSPGIDDGAGERDVEVYAIFRRTPDEPAFGEPFASIPAGLTSYSFTDTEVASGEQWIYGVAAQDCDGQSSGLLTSAQVTIP